MVERAMPGSVLEPRRWLVLVVVGLAQLMVVLDATVVNIALPSAQTHLGFSDADRQWVVTAYSLSFGSLLLLGGRLSDLVSRRRMFVIGVVGFALASALGGAAESFRVLITARVLQGAFGALLAPTALSVVTTTFTDPTERARAFGIFGAIAGAGGAIGLLLGGVLTEAFDWRWNLYINDVIAVVALVGAGLFVRHTPPAVGGSRLDLIGTTLATGALFALVFGITHVESDGWGAPVTWGPLGGFALLGGVFVLQQRRAPDPILHLSVVLDRNRGAALSAILIAAGPMFAVFLFVTYYLQSTLHYSPVQTGVAFLPMIGALVVAAQLSTARLVPRFGPKAMVPTAMLIGASGMLYLTHLGTSSGYVADVLPPLLILGIGFGSIMPPTMEYATLGVSPSVAGAASAMVNTSQQIGGSIGIALLNTLAASAISDYVADHLPPTRQVIAHAALAGYDAAYVWGAALFLVGALVTGLLFRRRPQWRSTVGQVQQITSTLA